VQNDISHILLSDISNHFPVAIFVKNFKPIPINSTVYVRNTRNFIAEEFLNKLSQIVDNLLSSSFKEESVDYWFDKFISNFSNLLDKHAPLKALFGNKKN